MLTSQLLAYSVSGGSTGRVCAAAGSTATGRLTAKASTTGYQAFAGACSRTSAGSPRRSSRLRSSSASISAPRSSATELSQSQVSITTTAASEPQVLLYELNRLA